MDVSGVDSDGREFTSAEEMWKEKVGEGDEFQKSRWYSQGVGYWKSVEATVDGVLGGYGHVNEPDVKCSELFLKTLLGERFPDAGNRNRLVALDCGAGIGRITKNLLTRYFDEVDVLEPVQHFLDAARVNLASECSQTQTVNFFGEPLQEFTPEQQRYNVMWIQWCIGHLSDDDFVAFFKRAKAGLKPRGFIVLKENIARRGFVLDNNDKSITRSDSYFKQLFIKCGLHIYSVKDQTGFPDELFAVKMYALAYDLPDRSLKKQSSKPKRSIKPGIIR